MDNIDERGFWGPIVNRSERKTGPQTDVRTRSDGRRPWSERFGELPQNWSDRLHNRKTGKSCLSAKCLRGAQWEPTGWTPLSSTFTVGPSVVRARNFTSVSAGRGRDHYHRAEIGERKRAGSEGSVPPIGIGCNPILIKAPLLSERRRRRSRPFPPAGNHPFRNCAWKWSRK